MAKAEIIRKRRELRERQAAERHSARVQAGIRRDAELLGKAPRVRILPEGAYLNRASLLLAFGECVAGELTGRAAGRDFADGTWYEGREVQRVLDSGACGPEAMGGLSVEQVWSADDLDIWQRRRLGLEEGGIVRHWASLPDLFGVAREKLDGAYGQSWPNGTPEFLEGHLWAAIAGDPARGACKTLAAALQQGCEIGFLEGDYHLSAFSGPRILWVRSLVGDPTVPLEFARLRIAQATARTLRASADTIGRAGGDACSRIARDMRAKADTLIQDAEADWQAARDGEQPDEAEPQESDEPDDAA